MSGDTSEEVSKFGVWLIFQCVLMCFDVFCGGFNFSIYECKMDQDVAEGRSYNMTFRPTPEFHESRHL